MSVGNLGKIASVYVLGNVLSKLVAFLLVPVYTQNLSSAEYGVLMICQASMAVLLPIMELGLRGGIQRYYVEFSDERKRQKFIFNIVSCIGGVGLAVVGLIEAVGEDLAALSFQSIDYRPYLRLAVWASFLKLLTLPSVAILRIQERPIPFSLIVYGGSVAKLAISVWFVAGLGWGIIGALEGILWGNALVLPVCFYVIYQNSSWGAEMGWLRRALIFGLPLIPHNLAHWVMSLSDRMVLENYTSVDEVGAYTLGYQLAQGVGLTIGAVNGALTPYMINRYRSEDRDDLFARLSTYFVVLSVVLVAGVILFGPYAIYVMATPGYYSAVQIIPIVAAGYLFLSLYHVPNTYLTIAENTRLIAVSSITAALANLVLNLWLVPIYGMHAAAWSTCFSYFLLFVGVFLGTKNVDVANYDFSRIGKALTGGGAIVAVYFVVTNVVTSTISGFASAVVLFLSYPFILMGMNFYSSEEVAFVRQSLRKLYAWSSSK